VEFNFDYCFNEIMVCFDKYHVEQDQKYEWEEIPDIDAVKLSAIPLTLHPGKYAIEPDHNGFGVNDDGQITLLCTHGAKPKMYHPVSTVCRI